MNSKSIFLCGFMGCGKSYIGKQVADSLSLPFFDLDLLIETTADSTIADIFKNRGENYFRSLEAQCLHHIAGIPRSVVALGGGHHPAGGKSALCKRAWYSGVSRYRLCHLL